MEVQNEKVVSLEFNLKNGEGELLDTTDESGPMLYLHGTGEIIPGLEAKLTGLKVGDEREIVLPADEGYGPYHEEKVITVGRNEFPDDFELEVGMQVTAETDDEEVPFWVSALDEEEVTLDGNHPLAGEELHFAVRIVDVRDAEAEELEHGHAHAAGVEH